MVSIMTVYNRLGGVYKLPAGTKPSTVVAQSETNIFCCTSFTDLSISAPTRHGVKKLQRPSKLRLMMMIPTPQRKRRKGRGTNIRVVSYSNQSVVFWIRTSWSWISTRSIPVSFKNTISTLPQWIARSRMRFAFEVLNLSFILIFHFEQDGEEKIPEPPSSDVAQGILPRLIATLVSRRRQVKALMKDKSATPDKIIQVRVYFF
jgi:hypothetical protein